MSAVLFNENPLVVNVDVAKIIGLNEAIVVQQISYWLSKSRNVRDGRVWSYNTVKGWKEQFPFWSERTIRRTLKELEDEGILITGVYNKDRRDKTKWYTLNFERMQEIGICAPSNAVGQNGHSGDDNLATPDRPNWTPSNGQSGQSITRDYTETSSETSAETTKTSASAARGDDVVVRIFKHWQEQTKHPRAKLDRKRRRLIKQSLDLGYTESDLREAITGCTRSPFHMGQNDSGKVHDGLDLILRSADKIDQFQDICHNPPRLQGKRARLDALNEQAVRGFLDEPDPLDDNAIDGEVLKDE